MFYLSPCPVLMSYNLYCPLSLFIPFYQTPCPEPHSFSCTLHCLASCLLPYPVFHPTLLFTLPPVHHALLLALRFTVFCPTLCHVLHPCFCAAMPPTVFFPLLVCHPVYEVALCFLYRQYLNLISLKMPVLYFEGRKWSLFTLFPEVCVFY